MYLMDFCLVFMLHALPVGSTNEPTDISVGQCRGFSQEALVSLAVGYCHHGDQPMSLQRQFHSQQRMMQLIQKLKRSRRKRSDLPFHHPAGHGMTLHGSCSRHLLQLWTGLKLRLLLPGEMLYMHA